MQTAEVIDIRPGAQEAAKALTVSEQATELTITDKPTYEHARELLLSIKDLRKQINDTFKPIIDKAHQAHKEAIAQQNKIEFPLIEAEGIIKNRIASFLAEEDRKRREEEERLRKLAEKAEEERRLAEAIMAEEEGNSEEAAAILNDVPAFMPPPVVQKTVETGEGISIKKNWKFGISDVAKIPREYMTPDMVKIGGVVRATKGTVQIPGIKIYCEDSVAVGRR